MKAVDVFLDESDELLKTFHCLGCGFVLMQYFDRLHAVVAASAISHKEFNSRVDPIIKGKHDKAPMIIQCHNRGCKMRYHIR